MKLSEALIKLSQGEAIKNTQKRGHVKIVNDRIIYFNSRKGHPNNNREIVDYFDYQLSSEYQVLDESKFILLQKIKELEEEVKEWKQ